ncbi:MAG TPA: bifunctional riboflavin kinase/FAD synthetase [Methylococcaceae bacterium]|nr:bifunctional riboflavin kinase/FAD synthetase [Methylococcaceae bacterium]
MHIARGLANLPPLPRGSVVTIGTFDGVHLGHHHLIRRLAAKGQELDAPVVVALFEPQPREYFQPGQAPARLFRLREKMVQLRELPVDVVLLLRFDRAFAEQPAAEFIRRVLIEGLRARYLVVGDDFRFGKGREGDFALLRKTGVLAGFEVSDTPTLTLHGRRISSTWVRELLEAGDCAGARQLLGRPYAVCGRVVHGDKKGRRLGFPTANIDLKRRNVPLSGVFAVTMRQADRWQRAGVANVGVRPTVDGRGQVWLEVHLFDFDGDLYQQTVEVQFHAKLRDERRFASLEALQTQIVKDAAAARSVLERMGFFSNNAFHP